MTRAEAIESFYVLMNELAKGSRGPMLLTDEGVARKCPPEGLYFFFENGELRPNGESRVVRIGTHGLNATSKSTLWGRLRQHMGHTGGANPGGGNHRGSIFRRHVGAALLVKGGDEDLLASWLAAKPLPGLRDAERSLELEVSRVIRAMPFLWLHVPTMPDSTSDRGFLERNLIALLSTMTGSSEAASPGWLGHHAVAPKVSASSLWNVNHVDEAFDAVALKKLQLCVNLTASAAARVSR